MKLNIGAFALAFGIWWGGGIFIATWWLIIVGEPSAPMLLDHFYWGYSVTPLGSLVGLIWGLVCGTICGGILAWLYNVLCERIGA